VAGHFAVVAQQLVIALHDAPGSDADADHSSCPLLTLQEQGIAHLLGDACLPRSGGSTTMATLSKCVNKFAPTEDCDSLARPRDLSSFSIL